MPKGLVPGDDGTVDVFFQRQLYGLAPQLAVVFDDRDQRQRQQLAVHADVQREVFRRRLGIAERQFARDLSGARVGIGAFRGK